MTRYEKVCNALMNKTKDTGNFITLTKNIDARHTGKYAIKNVTNNNVISISYKNLDEVITEYDLKIQRKRIKAIVRQSFYY